MRSTVSSHCGGTTIFPAHLRNEILGAIKSVATVPNRGAAGKVRAQLISSLQGSGWSGELPVSRDSDMTITSFKDEVGLCLQTGNVARIYADLMKLQVLYLDGAIKAAALVVPSRDVALKLGSNLAQSRRLERELRIFEKAYQVPSLVFSLE